MACPKGSKYIDGTCNKCGHVGKQIQPDICGPCWRIKSRDRGERLSEKKSSLVKRVNTVRRRFLALPPESQRDLIREFYSLHEVNWLKNVGFIC